MKKSSTLVIASALSSTAILTGVKAGDIVTVKPETDKSAKTITVVK